MNLTKKTVTAGSWMFSHTALSMLGTLARIAILARILTPRDFGVYGIATLALGLLETFSETSIDQALIQKKGLSNKDLTTAWYISAIRGLIIATILFVSAPFIGSFFKNTESIIFIRAIAFAPLIRNLANPNIVLLRRKMNFKTEFSLKTITTIIEFVVGITVSLLTRSVWGLVSAIIAGAISDVLVSFLLIKPIKFTKPNSNSAKKLLSFSKWLWGSSIITYMVNQGDDVVVGRVLGTEPLGLYQNAFKIASLPATQVTGIASQVVYPAFSSIQEDKVRLRRAFKKSFLITASVNIAISSFLFLFAKPITLIALGDQWLPIIPYLKILALYGAVRSVASVAGPIIKAMGRPDIITKFGLIRLALLVIFVYPLTTQYGLVGTSWAVVASTVLPQPYLLLKVRQLLS